jgi:hypothetical protein
MARHTDLIKAIALLLFAASCLAAPEKTPFDERSPTVGLSTRIDGVVLPGGELEVKPLEDRRTPIVLRIVNAFPHGTAWRYDLEYYGLAAGKFDLRDYLRRKDGSSTVDLPPIPIEVRSLLPPGQIEPNALAPQSAPFLGGYMTALWLGAILWLLGLTAILFAGRKRRSLPQVAQQPLTLADRLRPLVEEAMAGTLSPTGRAELERMLLVFWSQRLDLQGLKPAAAIAVLRKHPEAGLLLEQLEKWLHRPAHNETVDLAALLNVYRIVDAI